MTADDRRIRTPLHPKKEHLVIDPPLVKPLYRRGAICVLGINASLAGIRPGEPWPFTLVVPGIGLFFVHSETRSGGDGERVQSMEYRGTRDQILIVTND